MEIRNDRSTAKPTTTAEHNELLYCRMAMLGLDLYAIDGETFDKIKRRCATCDFWEACAVDLKRDPTNPVWEAYCPNSAELNALTECLVAKTLM
jgi:hypothetical protein